MKIYKQCQRCGWRGRTSQQRCSFNLLTEAGSYTCCGVLVRVRARQAAAKQKAQDVAARKLEHARRMVAEKTKAMKRLATSLRLWETRATYYARRASMTDAELEAERARRQEAKERQAAARARRAIKLDGVA